MHGIEKLRNIRISAAQTWILAGILVVFVLFFSILHPGFLSYNRIESIVFQFPELGILTIAMSVTMITGGINLSCIASANLSAIIMATIMNAFIPDGQDSWGIVFLSIFVGIGASTAVGILNGIIIARFEVPDILATLSTQMLIGGLNLVVTHGTIFSISSDFYREIGNGTLVGIPVPLIVFAVCAAIAFVVLEKTVQGRDMYIYGSNPIVSMFNGTGKTQLIIKTYALSGFFTGIAAVIMTSRFNSASAEYASSYLLQAVLIAVLAGVDPEGGKGKISGLIMAIILIQVISTGFNVLRIDAHLSTAIWGMILLISVLIGLKRND